MCRHKSLTKMGIPVRRDGNPHREGSKQGETQGTRNSKNIVRIANNGGKRKLFCLVPKYA
jgi:hypothetical protein